MRQRIRIAIEIVKEAARAIDEVPAMVFFSLGPLFLALAFVVAWIIVALYIFSVSISQIEPVDSSYIQKQFSSLSSSYTQGFNGTYTNLVWDANLKNAFAIHFFFFISYGLQNF